VSSRFKFSLGGFRSTVRVSEKLPDDQKFGGVAEICLFCVSCFFSSFFSLGGSLILFERKRKTAATFSTTHQRRGNTHTRLSQQDGRREKEQSQRHGESPREIKAEDEKRQPRKKPHVFKRIAIRDQERSAEQTAAEIERFSPTLHSQRNTSQRTEEESQRPRENVLPHERYRVFTPRTADENLSRVTRAREED
jgi:hypothetical protein